MAEIWTKLSSGKSGRRSVKSKKANPYSSRGLEKFAAVLDGIHGASLVERTASSLCAARSISRTAATLVRSTETKLAAFEALAPTKVESLEKDHVENSNEEKELQSGSVGIRSSLPERRTSSRRRSKSAFVVLMAMGTFLSTQLKPLAAVLTFRVVIQVWHKGKLSARLMFSSAALYFLTPLRSYLVTHILNRLPQTPVTQHTIPNSEIVISQPDPPVEESAPAPVLLPNPESSSVSMTVITGASSKSRRLAKRIASRLKKMNMFKSSSSSSEGSDHDSTVSVPSSPGRHRMCPFSKRSGSVDTEVVDVPSSTRKCIVMRRQRSSDSMGCSKKSKLGRRLSSETLEAYNISECSSASSSLQGKRPASDAEAAGNATSSSSPWPVVGLLITLLFLLVGRFPAIVATSLFFMVVCHDSRPPHSRAGRDNNRALEAARKLQRRTSPLRR